MTDVSVTLWPPCLCPSEGHKHGVSIQSSINLGDTLPQITCEWKTAETWFLARLFIYQLSTVSPILDFIHWMVTILVLIAWLVKTENCINGRYYMTVHGYEFYLWVFNSISHEWVQRMSEMLSWSQEDKIHIHKRACNSGAPADWTATKQSPILIWERKGNPSMNFLVVNMASGIARGRVPTTMTTATESRKMAAILQIIGWQGLTETSIYRLLLWYWTTLLWSIDTCQSKVSADQYHVTISWAQVYSSSRSCVFFEVDRWPSSVFLLHRGLMLG